MKASLRLSMEAGKVQLWAVLAQDQRYSYAVLPALPLLDFYSLRTARSIDIIIWSRSTYFLNRRDVL